MAAQRAEDPAYLVKYLLNGVTGTPMKDMLRTVTRTFRSKPVDKKNNLGEREQCYWCSLNWSLTSKDKTMTECNPRRAQLTASPDSMSAEAANPAETYADDSSTCVTYFKADEMLQSSATVALPCI